MAKQYGLRVIYDTQTGKVLNHCLGEMSGDLQEGLRPEEIGFIDLPYGYDENNFKQAETYHVDVTQLETASIVDRIVIDKYFTIS